MSRRLNREKASNQQRLFDTQHRADSTARRRITNNDCLRGKMEKEFRRPENWLSSSDRQGGWTVHFDDHLGRNLTIRIWDTGLRQAIPDSDQSDISWGYEICAYVTQRVHHGEITGQGDTPPSVKAILLDWQTDINIIVVNWALNDQ